MLKRLLASVLLTAAPAAAEVTLINVFEIPPGQRDAVVAGWEDARDFLSGQPGYIDTALHESLAGDSRFQLINIAHWDSPESFRAATEAMHAAGIFPKIEGLSFTPGLYTVIRED